MSSEWEKVRLEEVTSIIGDGLHGTPIYSEDGEYFFINGNNLGDGKITITESTKRAGKEEYLKHKKDLNERTILVSINGTLGNIGLYNNERVFLGKSACYMNVLDSVDKQYIRYVLTDRIFQNYIHSLATGSTIKNVSLKLMRNFEFQLPSLAIQQNISKILGGLDDKIALNTQINQTLEAMAQALFKSWFVDFDPVKAKMEARASGGSDEVVRRSAMAVISGKSDEELVQFEQENPEAFGQLAATADLFPETLVESELGMIPEGWEVSSVGEEFNVTMGQSPKGETYNEAGEGTLFFQGRAEFTWRFPSPRLHTTDPKRMAEAGDTLMSVRAPVGDVNIALDDCCVGRGLCAVRHKIGCVSYTYYQFLDLKRVLDSYNGEGTVFGSINQKDLKNIPVVKASKPVVDMFSSAVSDFDREIKNRSLENLVLAQTRDTLLPKLLSGEIDLSSFGSFGEVGE